jgi:drug/metabolite transporter (DMT)-like permease
VESISSHRRGQILVGLAAVAWSTAGLFQRELDLDVATQLAGRAAFAFVALLVYVRISQGPGVQNAFRSIGWPGIGVAVCMATASGCFIVALNHTTVAHVLFTQAISPLLAAVLGWIVLRERVSHRVLAAMAIALAGVALMVGGPGGADAVGDGVALVMSLSFAIAIVITRRSSHVSMAPATCLAQLLLVVVAMPFAHPGAITGHDLVYLVALGGFQMGLGLALFTAGARLIAAAEVALITLLEVVLGPLWVWLAFTETPDRATLLGGAVVLLAVLVHVTADLRLPVRMGATPPPP